MRALSSAKLLHLPEVAIHRLPILFLSFFGKCQASMILTRCLGQFDLCGREDGSVARARVATCLFSLLALMTGVCTANLSQRKGV